MAYLVTKASNLNLENAISNEVLIQQAGLDLCSLP